VQPHDPTLGPRGLAVVASPAGTRRHPAPAFVRAHRSDATATPTSDHSASLKTVGQAPAIGALIMCGRGRPPSGALRGRHRPRPAACPGHPRREAKLTVWSQRPRPLRKSADGSRRALAPKPCPTPGLYQTASGADRVGSRRPRHSLRHSAPAARTFRELTPSRAPSRSRSRPSAAAFEERRTSRLLSPSWATTATAAVDPFGHAWRVVKSSLVPSRHVARRSHRAPDVELTNAHRRRLHPTAATTLRVRPSSTLALPRSRISRRSAPRRRWRRQVVLSQPNGTRCGAHRRPMRRSWM